MHIAILGGGHAGIEAAVSARQAGAEVTVYCAESVQPYFRPRLIAVAMGQADPASIAIHPPAWYAEKGIRLNLGTPVTAYNPVHHTVTAAGTTTAFDALILAPGSAPMVGPRFSGELSSMPIFNLWSMEDALAIRSQVKPGMRMLIIGGGILAVECALRAGEQKMRVTVVERMSKLVAAMLNDHGASVLRAHLESHGIAVQLSRCIAEFRRTNNPGISVVLDDGAVIDADIIIRCMGCKPNVALAQKAGLPVDRGIRTDSTLQVVPGVFAAGDAAQVTQCPARGSVREAINQGRLAGSNAVSALTNRALTPFTCEPVPVSMRCAGVDVCAVGCNTESGLTEERLDDGTSPFIFRAVTRRESLIAGIQMIGSREGFDAILAAFAAQGCENQFR